MTENLTLTEKLTAVLFVQRISNTSIFKITDPKQKINALYHYVQQKFQCIDIDDGSNPMNHNTFVKIYNLALKVYNNEVNINHIKCLFDLDTILLQSLIEIDSSVAIKEFSYCSINKSTKCILNGCDGELKPTDRDSGCIWYQYAGKLYIICNILYIIYYILYIIYYI